MPPSTNMWLSRPNVCSDRIDLEAHARQISAVIRTTNEAIVVRAAAANDASDPFERLAVEQRGDAEVLCVGSELVGTGEL